MNGRKKEGLFYFLFCIFLKGWAGKRNENLHARGKGTIQSDRIPHRLMDDRYISHLE